MSFKAIVACRDCCHRLCLKHAKDTLRILVRKRSKCEKIHGKRQFVSCERCDIEIPADQLEKHVQEYEARLSSSTRKESLMPSESAQITEGIPKHSEDIERKESLNRRLDTSVDMETDVEGQLAELANGGIQNQSRTHLKSKNSYEMEMEATDRDVITSNSTDSGTRDLQKNAEKTNSPTVLGQTPGFTEKLEKYCQHSTQNEEKKTAATGLKKRMEEEQDHCPVVLFESRLISKFTYGGCDHEETVDDQLFRSIMVPVQENVKTLENGLHLFFKGEEFPSSTLPCRECNVSPDKHTVTTQVLQIVKAPEILMLQLARFEEVPMAGSYKELRKTDHIVEFGKSLILEKQYHQDKRELQFQLYGVVLHSGSMHGGHYTSFVRKAKTNRWFYCNDSSVREVRERMIFQESTFRKAYVLFYSDQI
ncbi:putative ubiquitin carboxyl-terminal hydrolase 50 [Ylistrum balloti]|uniref:putative ubiquitin carboxyl-terminal hydrolase 50 n=1 Tax=Ylistrum balloti TaxID=509963 RepID=UPI002905B36B|nr:putative ubiquitin carboxyl-terminal hydrolase 50 [Ylistrum balloti]